MLQNISKCWFLAYNPMKKNLTFCIIIKDEAVNIDFALMEKLLIFIKNE